MNYPQISNLKLLIAMRHGEHHLDVLTAAGKDHVIRTGAMLRDCIPQFYCVRIFCSNLNRSVETARIISERFTQFGVSEPVREKIFSSHEFESGKNMLAEVNFHLEELTPSTDAVIIVTHGEAPSGIMAEYSKFAGLKPVPSRQISEGEALILDTENGKLRYSLDMRRHLAAHS